MSRTFSVASLLFVVCSLVAVFPAQAQEFPGLGVGGIYEMNMRFEREFDAYARRRSWELARAIPNDQPLPFNAMTISNSISNGMRAFEANSNNWHNNSNRALSAVERWDNAAIRNVAPYSNPYGGANHMLPHYHNSYYHDQNGYIYSGSNPYYPNNNMSYRGW